MKQKLINLGYVLAIIGLVLGGTHNILSSHPIISQKYNKFWTGKEKIENAVECETENTTSGSKEQSFQTETNPNQTETKVQTQAHIHTWREECEFIWVSAGNGKGHVEEKVIVKCECGAIQK